MIAMLLLGPIGVLPSEWQTTAKPPSNHAQSSVEEIFPPAPMGLGFISPSVVHLPTKYPRRLCSGPGVCGGGVWAAATIPSPTETRAQRVRSGGSLFSFGMRLPPGVGPRILPSRSRRDNQRLFIAERQ